MKKKEIDPKKLSGEALFHYYTKDYQDEDYRSIVELLPVAVGWDQQKAFDLLEKSVKEDRTFVAVYPGQEKDPVDTSNMVLVGSIDDGALYLK